MIWTEERKPDCILVVDEKEQKSGLERFIPGIIHDSELHAMHTARYEFATRYIRDKVVVDIACGVGYGSAMMVKGKPQRIVGIDISPDAVEHARHHFAVPGLEFLCGSAEHIDSIRPIDLVISFETIEHIHEYDEFLSRVATNLKPGGKLIISTPLRQNGTFGDKPANPFHVQEWSEPEFDLLLSRYFKTREKFWQFVYKKFNYPGSRTISQTVCRILYPSRFKAFEGYHVTQKAPHMSGVPITAGFVVVVCSDSKASSAR